MRSGWRPTLKRDTTEEGDPSRYGRALRDGTNRYSIVRDEETKRCQTSPRETRDARER